MAHEDCPMKALLISNDPTYGTERVYNAQCLGDGEIMEGAHRSTMDELAVATVEADKVQVH
jgi:sulfur relay (sulfurtransferase) complex TusBCD TusD component (DsrE family)